MLTKEQLKQRSRERCRAWRKKNKDRVRESNQAWHAHNRQRAIELNQAWRQKNREARMAQLRKRYREDHRYRVELALRNRLWIALTKAKSSQCKSASAVVLVGCSINDLMRHLESQFLPGMTWENHGAWHIDHRRPCVSFDLTSATEQQKCFHYTNLQPLWAIDNWRKNARVVEGAGQ